MPMMGPPDVLSFDFAAPAWRDFEVDFGPRFNGEDLGTIRVTRIPVTDHAIGPYLLAVPQILRTAQRTFLARRHPRQSHETEAAHLARIDGIIPPFFTAIRCVSPGPHRHYAVIGHQRFDPPQDVVRCTAASPLDAALTAHIALLLDRDEAYIHNLDWLPDRLGQIEIDSLVIDHDAELKDAFAELVREAAEAGYSGPALDRAQSLIEEIEAASRQDDEPAYGMAP